VAFTFRSHPHRRATFSQVGMGLLSCASIPTLDIISKNYTPDWDKKSRKTAKKRDACRSPPLILKPLRIDVSGFIYNARHSPLLEPKTCSAQKLSNDPPTSFSQFLSNDGGKLPTFPSLSHVSRSDIDLR